MISFAKQSFLGTLYKLDVRQRFLGLGLDGVSLYFPLRRQARPMDE